MTEPRLSSPLLTVIRENEEPLTVQTNNQDLVLWDLTRVKHKWPRLDDAPFVWFTFISWAAARRTGAITPETRYEDWSRTVLDINPHDDDDDDDEAAPDLGRPIPPIHGLA